MKAQKSLTERLIHAVGFEVMALLICAPVAAWIMNKPVLEMGVLSILLSTTAMVWNVVYNSVFDYFWPMGSVKRTFPLRVGHALGFEGGFILIGLPIAAWWLQISLIDAFVLELGFFLFFLPYTIGYNWLYDTLRQRVMSRKRNQAREPLRR
ncbi:multidrug/biocide efflux PACE transporter [Rouxiella badensis]|nr:multidrug/biocide efflux PACE transporter [Rouxiella badensis]MCC3703033.1 multidrug/biocide efflux PACE transporter [Rouxiella badensis]MCC3721225.1 multidrug/biocide efflux PACE transporter [Rouxiella badensis]MCC3730880.1 multidrug/biocide efflux PACE transporter [Rouxiella badensis]MCC3734552.1 multidrug/biocide efflux PACE transporter [Rouxiella badensis]MCC3742463.1 multidrug/biocide efflux PACE transporter [Rouxiella badensis]